MAFKAKFSPSFRSFSTFSPLRHPRRFSGPAANFVREKESPEVQQSRSNFAETISPTLFGSIRLDDRNRPQKHGQLDDMEKAGENFVPDFDVSTSRVVEKRVERNPVENVSPAESGPGGFFFESAEKVPKFPTLNLDDFRPPPKEAETVFEGFVSNPKPRFRGHFLDNPVFEGEKSPAEARKRVVRESKEDKFMSALDYVKTMRPTKVEKVEAKLSKESEVLQIGASLQSRLMRIADQVDKKTPKRREKDPDCYHDPDLIGGVGRVNAKFLPANLKKMTSADISRLLKASIIYNNNDLVAINKPYGLHMDEKSGGHVSLDRFLPDLAKHVGCENLHQVHRLDRTTTGVLLYAKTNRVHEKLVRLFRQRRIRKQYWALVNGTPEPGEGIINIPISQAKIGDRFRMTVQPDYRGKPGYFGGKKAGQTGFGVLPAVTEYVTVTKRGNASLVALENCTGFKHQLRVHMGFGMGCPILGDHKYSNITDLGRPQMVHNDILERLGVRESRSRDLPIFLHAKKISIPEVVENGVIVITAGLPFFFTKTMKTLKLAPTSVF